MAAKMRQRAAGTASSGPGKAPGAPGQAHAAHRPTAGVGIMPILASLFLHSMGYATFPTALCAKYSASVHLHSRLVRLDA